MRVVIVNHRNEGTHPLINFYTFLDRSGALKRCDDVAPPGDDMSIFSDLELLTLKFWFDHRSFDFLITGLL